MIDPMTALAGIQSAVALIKKASKTIDDVASLGPVLGKYFDAKSKATQAAKQAKTSGSKSNMAAAIEIEMALHQAEELERQLQLLFMQAGKIDVWNKIKARSRAMDMADASNAAKEAKRSKQRQQEMREIFNILLVTTITLVIVAGIGYGIFRYMGFLK